MKLTEDQIRRIARQEASKSTRSGGGVGGGISASWVEENYISKAFFNRIFEIYGPGEHSGDPDVQVEPNDTDTTISNIKALAGFWTEEYVSALGLSDDGGGGGGSSALYNMLDVKPNSDASPTRVYGLNGTASDNGKVLAYSTTYGKWIAQTVQSGGGSVTSITAGTGLSTSPSGSITSTGTISISATFQSYISHGESAYNALDNYLLKTAGVTAIVVGTGANADKIGVTINGSNTGFITVPFATSATSAGSADKLSVVSKTAWGQTYWTSGGVPDSISGNMTSVGDISFAASGKKIGGFLYFDTTNTRLGVNVSSPSYRLDVDGNTRISGLVGLGGAPDSSYRLNVVANTVSSVSHGIKVGGFSYLNGNTGISAAPSTNYALNVGGYTKTTRLYLSDSVYLEYDSANGGVYLYGAGFYTDSYVSALGLSSGGGITDYIPLSGSSNISGALVPITSNNIDLGSSSKHWGTVYCNAISGNASVSVQNVQCVTLSVGAMAVLSYGAKMQSICIECASGGTPDTNRIGEINRYTGALHLQYNTANNLTLCKGGGTLQFGNANAGQHFQMSNNWIDLANVYLRGNGDNVVFDGTDTDGGTVKGVNGMTIVAGSDIRLKDIISDAVCDIEDIANAPIFNFEWKANKKREHLGTSAQYWQKVFKNAIYEDEEGMLSMEYGATALASAVITARKVMNHEERIAALEQENKQLRAEVERLKAS